MHPPIGNCHHFWGCVIPEGQQQRVAVALYQVS